MTARRARELPSAIQHLPKYVPPDPDRIRHDTIWQRALDRWKPDTRVTVRFKRDGDAAP